MKNSGWNVELDKVHKHSFRNRKLMKSISNLIVIAYDQPLYRLQNSGWNGEYIYIEHGLSPMKYYTYKYNFFHKSTILFYPGEVFKRKMEVINPNFENGLLGGYPKIDELLTMEIDKSKMCEKYGLDSLKPIILFSPSWGGKRNINAGIHNAKHLKNIDNLIIVPHSADYRLAKKYGAVVPKDSNINQFLHLADIVISDASSVLAEASILKKQVIQMILPSYPGCFPEIDRRKNDSWISDEIIAEEMKTNREQRPFKIPYLNEDWDFGNSSVPQEIDSAIEKSKKTIGQINEKQNYWAEQSCYKPDGKTSHRIMKMIEHFINTGERKQVA
ncbi:MAG: CDP-glycerol glycerophosphotransferase family protein [Nitrosopumilus sp.]|nr:CDP-glycerol glycerophosphotransferase family protein [Nitrosopumilus sp.]